MTLSQIMTLAHKIANESNLEGSYAVKMQLGLRAAHDIAKYIDRLGANSHVEICKNHISISDGYNALADTTGVMFSFFLGSVMQFEETQGERFTRRAMERFRQQSA